MSKTKSVGLLVMTEVPGKGLCAVLQKRGEWNFEKNEPESWPGACQVTVRGKIEDGEDEEGALNREIKEELGDEFADDWLDLRRTDGQVGCFLVNVTTDAAGTFVARVSYEMVSRVRLHAGSGGLWLVQENEISLVKPLDRDSLYKYCRLVETTMFEDEIWALKLAFLCFKNF